MNFKIAISSGKGGTGKTLISTNLARIFEQKNREIRYLDCDVEEPNGHLFLKPEILNEEDITILSPVGVNNKKCINCGKCVTSCKYNAIALIKDKILIFKNLCHVCGACKIACKNNAIVEEKRKIGKIINGKSGNIDFNYALLETGEGGMSPRLIKKVKQNVSNGINIIDSPPGTSCPVVETVKDSDLCVLVTDPTPFGINDLKLAVDMCRSLKQEPVIIINRAEYFNNDLKKYCKKEKLKIIAEIPDDRAIAECYSVGNLVVNEIPKYNDLFSNIAENIFNYANKKVLVKTKPKIRKEKSKKSGVIEYNIRRNTRGISKIKELVVISGKGGTGKTSIVASFCALEKKIAIADCDVDAADLHLILKPKIIKKGFFSGGEIAEIDNQKCTLCEDCYRECKFGAININDKNNFIVERMLCEGCGVCELVCKYNAAHLKPAINGEWFRSITRFGPMSHAKLGIAEENSGKLVSLVRNNKNEIADKAGINISIIDGSPGTGCPVIASITGTDYAVIVTEPTVSGIHDLKRILDVTRFFSIKSGIIINKYDLNISKSREIKRIVEVDNHDFLGLIPYNKIVTEAQIKGMSVIEYSMDEKMRNIITDIWEKIKFNIGLN